VDALLAVGCAALGLIVGSFLNVVIWRVPRGESVVRPASHCPACGHAIKARDNVPVVSWLLLRGRCRHCGARISPRYPVVEMVTGAVWAAFALRLGADAALPAYLYLGAVGVALALIDLDVRRLPDVLVLPSYAVGLLLLALPTVVHDEPGTFLRVVLGMVALFGAFFLLVLIYPKGMGFGDVKLAGVLGMYLGYLSWGVLVVGGFFGFLLGALVGGALMLGQRAGRKTAIPFGPFMLLGAFIAILWGQPIADAYVNSTLG
jgi:leader peptidase (prepilin peptidase) / N-methyltransferase